MPRYSIDTCSLGDLRRHYPRDVFPGVWGTVSELAHGGIVVASEEVFRELEVFDDEVFAWAKGLRQMFLPTDAAVQAEVTKILAAHQSLVDFKKKHAADPFVIAVAVIHGCTVVSQETPSGNPNRQMIPDVCKQRKLSCIKLLEMLRREGLRF
ncbi:MAG: DUF4411 family protein [Candidatus Riflebacteria bacterium]|nr:DUF4411 family protein [Candidatus Riflebacteria bacterium]